MCPTKLPKQIRIEGERSGASAANKSPLRAPDTATGCRYIVMENRITRQLLADDEHIDNPEIHLISYPYEMKNRREALRLRASARGRSRLMISWRYTITAFLNTTTKFF